MIADTAYQRCISWIHRGRAVSYALALAIVLFPLVVSSRSAQAQTFRVLYSFKGKTDGSSPNGDLVRDAAGNLYGTAHGGAFGYGVVFKVDMSGKETVLYSFTGGADGSGPDGGLVRDAAGNLYGTAGGGGAYGRGVVFKLDTTGKETVLYSFTYGDGSNLNGELVRDTAGNLYGTAYLGGAFGYGVVFKLDTTGTETLLHSFAGYPGDGASPVAGLVLDTAGNLYGTTPSGGAHNEGTVFKVDTTGTESVLHSFAGHPTDGREPMARLVRDSTGRLYGTTRLGGSQTFGAVFRLGTNGKDTLLYNFTGGADGAYPFAGVVRDRLGNLYGTTNKGGDVMTCSPPGGCGTVFKVDPTGTETVLYSFTGHEDIVHPVAGLTLDAAGNLYGTASGGAFNLGVVFEVSP